jgi:hypothetical protein
VGTNVQYLIVATSEFVTRLFGPATEVGSFATSCLSLSVQKTKTLQEFPSFFDHVSISSSFAAADHFTDERFEAETDVAGFALTIVISQPSSSGVVC